MLSSHERSRLDDCTIFIILMMRRFEMGLISWLVALEELLASLAWMLILECVVFFGRIFVGLHATRFIITLNGQAQLIFLMIHGAFSSVMISDKQCELLF